MEDWPRLDAGLIARAVRGDTEARNAIACRVLPRIRLMVLARLCPAPHHLHQVDDLVQGVAQALMQGLERLQQADAEGVRRFLSSIVAHKVADVLAARVRPQRGPAVSLEETVDRLDVAGAMGDLLSASGTTPSGAAVRSERVARVLAELGRLPERQREAIVLAFFDQLPTAAIAERLGVSRPAASMLLIRALRTLRRCLSKQSALVCGADAPGASGDRHADQ